MYSSMANPILICYAQITSRGTIKMSGTKTRILCVTNQKGVGKTTTALNCFIIGINETQGFAD